MAGTMAPEFKFNLDADPTPDKDKPSRRQKAESKRGPGRPPNTSIRKQIVDEVNAMILLIGVPVSMRDPHCGGALVQQANDIAEALADIAMKNDALRRILLSGGDAMMYFKLATALMPVGVTVYQHHFVKAESESEGQSEYGIGPSFVG